MWVQQLLFSGHAIRLSLKHSGLIPSENVKHSWWHQEWYLTHNASSYDRKNTSQELKRKKKSLEGEAVVRGQNTCVIHLKYCFNSHPSMRSGCGAFYRADVNVDDRLAGAAAADGIFGNLLISEMQQQDVGLDNRFQAWGRFFWRVIYKYFRCYTYILCLVWHRTTWVVAR